MECYPTPEELRQILGPDWAICRNTERNRQRYGRCITPKEYQRACDEAMERRKQGAHEKYGAIYETNAGEINDLR